MNERKPVSAEDFRLLCFGLDRDQIIQHIIEDCDLYFKEQA